MLHKSIWVGNDFFLHQRIIFLTIWGKNLTAAINFFHQILKNCHSFLTRMDLYDPYMVPYTIP